MILFILFFSFSVLADDLDSGGLSNIKCRAFHGKKIPLEVDRDWQPEPLSPPEDTHPFVTPHIPSDKVYQLPAPVKVPQLDVVANTSSNNLNYFLPLSDIEFGKKYDHLYAEFKLGTKSLSIQMRRHYQDIPLLEDQLFDFLTETIEELTLDGSDYTIDFRDLHSTGMIQIYFSKWVLFPWQKRIAFEFFQVYFQKFNSISK